MGREVLDLLEAWRAAVRHEAEVLARRGATSECIEARQAVVEARLAYHEAQDLVIGRLTAGTVRRLHSDPKGDHGAGGRAGGS
jgi:hypothetical protein